MVVHTPTKLDVLRQTAAERRAANGDGTVPPSVAAAAASGTVETTAVAAPAPDTVVGDLMGEDFAPWTGNVPPGIEVDAEVHDHEKNQEQINSNVTTRRRGLLMVLPLTLTELPTRTRSPSLGASPMSLLLRPRPVSFPSSIRSPRSGSRSSWAPRLPLLRLRLSKLCLPLLSSPRAPLRRPLPLPGVLMSGRSRTSGKTVRSSGSGSLMHISPTSIPQSSRVLMHFYRSSLRRREQPSTRSSGLPVAPLIPRPASPCCATLDALRDSSPAKPGKHAL